MLVKSGSVYKIQLAVQELKEISPLQALRWLHFTQAEHLCNIYFSWASLQQHAKYNYTSKVTCRVNKISYWTQELCSFFRNLSQSNPAITASDQFVFGENMSERVLVSRKSWFGYYWLCYCHVLLFGSFCKHCAGLTYADCFSESTL